MTCQGYLEGDNYFRGQGDTALLLACKAGNLELATRLLEAGADVSVANEQDHTALLLACKAGNLELATRLMDAGANVSVANKQSDTPLLAAVAIGNLVGRDALAGAPTSRRLGGTVQDSYR
jgi:ankyrin repeat protein